MRKSRFSDEQVIAILREQEAGRPTAEVCRKLAGYVTIVLEQHVARVLKAHGAKPNGK